MKQVLTSSDEAILVYVAPTKALVTQVRFTAVILIGLH